MALALPLAITLVASVAAPPRTVLVVSRRTGISEANALAFARRVAATLTDAGLPLALSVDAAATTLGEPVSCPTPPGDCLSRIGAKLDVDALVAVELLRIDDDLAVRLDAVRVRDGRRLLNRSFVTGLGATAAELAIETVPFAQALSGLLAPPPLDVPKPAALEPAPQPTATVVITNAPQPRALAPAMTGVTLAAGAAAATLLALATATRGELEAHFNRGTGVTDLPYSRAQELVDLERRANGLYTASLVSTCLTAALVVATLYLWAVR